MSKFRPGGLVRDIPCFDNPGPLKRAKVHFCQDCGCGLDKKKKRCFTCFDIHQAKAKQASKLAKRAKAKETVSA